jgi:hypothetical protein
MLRNANLAPPTSSSFDPLWHLRRGDIRFFPDRLVVYLRWTKTLQRINQSSTITLLFRALLCALSPLFALFKPSFLFVLRTLSSRIAVLLYTS